MRCFERRSRWCGCDATAVARATLAVCLAAGLLVLAGCGWLFSEPESGTITEEEAEQILATQHSGAALYRELVGAGEPDPAGKVIQRLLDFPGVAEAHADHDGAVWITYESGLVGVLLPEHHMRPPFAGVQRLQPRSCLDASSERSTDRLSSESHPAGASMPGNTRAAILVFKDAWVDGHGADTARELLEDIGYSVEMFVGSEFTVKCLESLTDFGVILFFTHGHVELSGDQSATVWLTTGQKVNPVSVVSLTLKYGTNCIAITTPLGEEGPWWRPSSWFAFNQRFIKDQRGRFPNSLVVAHACSSFQEPGMANAFRAKGAAAYLGWTDISNGSFAERATYGMFKTLSQPGVSISEALMEQSIYIEEHGPYSVDQLFPAKYWYCDEESSAYHFLEPDLYFSIGEPLCKPFKPDFQMDGAGDLVLLDRGDVTLTLYVHEGDADGPVIVGARVQGSDAAGNAFDEITNASGYVTITGEPGTWAFTVSKSGYKTRDVSVPVNRDWTTWIGLEKELRGPPPGCTVVVQPGEYVQNAIDRAPEGGVVCLPEGTWTDEYVHIDKSLTLRVAGADVTLLYSHSPSVMISSPKGSGSPVVVGMEDLKIIGATGYDGGVSVWGDTAQVSIRRCVFAGSASIMVYESGQVAVSDCRFSGDGFGVYLLGASRATIADSVFEGLGNTGLFLTGTSQAVVTDSTFSNCLAAVSTRDSTKASISRSTLSGNRSGITLGGAVEVDLWDNRIFGSTQYGVALVEPPCFEASEYHPPFSGRVAGGRNTIPGPGQSNGNFRDVCPEELRFLMTAQGGALDRR